MLKRLATTLGVMVTGALGGMLVMGIVHASRNSSGTYSVPSTGYPFVTGTAISSSTMVGIFGDIATEMTDSLDRSGKGGMLAPLRVPDGSLSTPTLSFNNETGSGLFRNGAADLRMSLTGTSAWKWAGTGSGPMTGNYASLLAAPAGLGSDQVLTLPALPGSTLPLQLSAAGAITTGQVQTAQIADLAVTAAKIANTTITRAQMASVGQQVSSSSGSFTNNAGGYIDVTNLTVTITTGGRPVFLSVQSDGQAAGFTMMSNAASGQCNGGMKLLRGAGAIAEYSLEIAGASANPIMAITPYFTHVDVVGAGTYTYKIQATASAGCTIAMGHAVLVAYEL